MCDVNKWTSIAKRLLIIFLAVQPCLDLLLNVCGDERLTVFGVSVFTLIRYALLGVTVLVGIACTFKKRITKAFVVFLVAALAYIAVHALHVNALTVLANGEPIRQGIVQSMIFVSKYLLPICVIFLTIMLRFGYAELRQALIAAVCVTSVCILVSNLLGTDYMAYAFGSTEHPSGNLFSWFRGGLNEDNWRLFTSRGWFVSGNELGGFFLLTLPVTLFVCLKEKRWWWYVVAAVQLITMLMIGTRVAVYGAFLAGGLMLLAWVVYLFMTKTRVEVRQLIGIGATLLVFGVFFVVSPFANRIRSGEASIDGSNPGQTTTTTTTTTTTVPSTDVEDPDGGTTTPSTTTPPVEEADPKEELREAYRKDPYQLYLDAQVKYGVPWYLLGDDVYHYNKHTEFWIDLIVNRPEDIGSARDLKVEILEDLRRQNGSALDLWFGIGPTHFYPELDFVAQYYYLGILGFVLLIVPYMLVLVWAAIELIRRLLRGKVRLFAGMLTAVSVLMLMVGFVAGHVLLPILVPVFLGACIGTAFAGVQPKCLGEGTRA